jgi:hypothetical protein
MKKTKLRRFLLSLIILSLFSATSSNSIAQIPKDEIPNQTGNSNSNTSNKNKTNLPGKDDRVIIQNNVDIVEDDACECANVYIRPEGARFPKYFLFGFISLPYLIVQHDDGLSPLQQPLTLSPSSP